MRLFFVVVRILALGTVVTALIARADCVFATHTCRADNLLSYFTIQSNLAYAVLLAVLLVLGVAGWRERSWMTAVRMLLTTYLIVSGVTFCLLILNAGLSDIPFLVPASSKILHFVIPAYALIDFLLNPARRRLRWAVLGVSLIFPALYGAYTLIRGPATGWYPYIFFDPAWTGSYAATGFYAAILAALIAAISAGLVATTRLTSPLQPFVAAVPAQTRADRHDESARVASTFDVR
ncbi:Pr6Pr family membrane protein [Subtercola vilae]|uniref:Pr6Pr family membrane protein n=1 Tax=Subtercola vilae TaxID=2056433 RepID=A0A4T2C7G9_9MICO|nr:Pr6Pr family membrane protein [Subtercola vilae]TIH40157.1 hypothetical protein D4765_03265 [Subtercola vilae]